MTTPAYLLGQVFLAGPLRLLGARQNMRNIIRTEHGLGQRLTTLLEEIRAKGKWHSVADYADRRDDVALLVRMEQVEYSARKGRIRG